MSRLNADGKNIIEKLKSLHLRNRKKGVYGYMWWTGVKIILIYAAVMVPVVLIGKYLIDVNSLFSILTDHVPDALVFVIFLISESTFGMIPPDLFVIWSAKFNSPFLLLTILGILSYMGGILAFYIGRLLSGQKKIRAYSERVLYKYIKTARKWGGAFIVIAALFPFIAGGNCCQPAKIPAEALFDLRDFKDYQICCPGCVVSGNTQS